MHNCLCIQKSLNLTQWLSLRPVKFELIGLSSSAETKLIKSNLTTALYFNAGIKESLNLTQYKHIHFDLHFTNTELTAGKNLNKRPIGHVTHMRK